MATVAHDGHGHGNAGPGGEGPMIGSEHIHHPPLSVYLKTFFALMILLVFTVVMYYVDLSHFFGGWKGINLIVALIIACVKATLVVLYFMNVKGSTRLTWLWAGLGFVWLLLMGGIFMDYQSRAWMEAKPWQNELSTPAGMPEPATTGGAGSGH
jgi:cytochrome c oxidase subunit 4